MSQGYTPRHRRRTTTGRIMLGALAAAAVAPAIVIAAAPAANAALCASAPGKCFRVDLSPTTFVAGSTQQFTAYVLNEGPVQTLGSVNIDAPAGYTITNVAGGTVGTTTQAGNEIQLRTLSLPPGSTDTVTFTAATPADAGSATWTAVGKQSNDFNGTGNDFVLDPTSQLTTSGSPSTTGPSCTPTDVSCGTNFITYNKPSRVSTGTTVNSSVWFVGHIDFPATSVVGGQLYTLEAPASPDMCPVDGSLVQCTFQMNLQDIPNPYDAAHTATLTMLCDPSHCAPNTVTSLFKKDAAGNVTPILPCLGLTADPCFTTSRDANNVETIVLSNLSAGDPSILGMTI
jgi:hypothetical protein